MQSQMKLESISATEVRVPMKPGHVDSAMHGDPDWKHLPKWVLELKFDNGVVGLGESPRGVAWNEVESFGRSLLGKKLSEIQFQRIYLLQEASNDMLAAKDSKIRWNWISLSFLPR